MKRYRVSAVSYLNTIPFIDSIRESHLKDKIDLSLDYPSVCANKLINQEVDVALSPIVVLKDFPEFNIISDYCIGSNGQVDTVCLYSNVPLKEIEKIFLDSQSRTSVELIKILCREYWNIKPVFVDLKEEYYNYISKKEAALIIGDRAFLFNKKYRYIYDLSYHWKEYTKLPFVFACWFSNKNLDPSFSSDFNNIIKNGLQSIDDIIKNRQDDYLDIDLKDYLKNKISYVLDEKKRKSMRIFLSKINSS